MKQSKSGISLLELLIVMITVGLLGVFSVSGILKAREKTRQSRCALKLKKILRGVQQYENTQGCYPPGRLFPDFAKNGQIKRGYTNYQSIPQTEEYSTGFYSVHTWILPYVRASHIFDMIDFSRAQGKKMENPRNINFDAYVKPMPLFRCPADVSTEKRPTENNYRYNFGGDTPGAGIKTWDGLDSKPSRFDQWFVGGTGAFTIGLKGLETGEFEDGLTHTVFFSERTRGENGDPNLPPSQTDMVRCRSVPNPLGSVEFLFELLDGMENRDTGFIFRAAGSWPKENAFSDGWPFGMYTATQYNHVSPPNWRRTDCGVSFVSDTPLEHAIVAARSRHPNSVNVAYGDGRVKNIKDDIDLTIWRALGSRNGGELIPQKRSRRPRRRPF